MNIVSWFSAGVSSAIATHYALRKYPELKIIYIDIDNHHEDSMRFVKDCQLLFKKEIEILKSPYKNVENCIRQFKYINGVNGARCTMMLKKRVRQEWEMNNRVDLYIWGMDCSKREVNRAERIKETMTQFKHEFPLIDNKITKKNAHGILESFGIKRPKMYDLGYPNNNCVGCVKGGKGYWNKIRKDFPGVFERMSKIERELGYTCLKDTYLDELESNRGHEQKIIVPDCGMFCEKE